MDREAYKKAEMQEKTNNLKQILSFLKEYPCRDRDVIDVDIFDNGCEPTGMQLSLLAEHTTGRVVGTNIFEGFPEDTVEHNRPNTEFYYMDGQNLYFLDNSFDVVMSFNVLEHVPSPAKYLKECYRVLRSGGFGFFSWQPIWSSANGHHMHPGMVEKEVKKLGITPPPNYLLDGTTIPFWGHLLLTSDEMYSLLVNDKKYVPRLVEWMVNYIYKKERINRCFWQDFLSAFNEIPWKILEIKEHKNQKKMSQDILKQLILKYKFATGYQTNGATIIVQKP